MSRKPSTQSLTQHDLAGTWVTAHGYVRQDLHADGRYEETRGFRKAAYRGTWTVSDNRIVYVDERGFSARADVVDGEIHHAGMRLFRIQAAIAA
ncbi:hypothetical protein FHW69_002620 [Luteibacter sp. Sphag1AF]|uniref:Atu4866 domain-containing protein n=1 Tax=Luteibacter sp. Sphag1AF TaxID=2587031 RepID=UPI00160CB72A|nr:Atu4866 domain-containing protein [Luteibacter sp. Sphag1AF]MBB3227988.1 hypothetical protein [Luteibacter sp. Sphag1AF]